MPHEPTGERATAREWAGLALLVLPMLTLTSDLSVLFFALPTLSADLDPSASQALWIVHVYGFLVAGFLVTMGRLGDRVGPRRLLLIGASAFAAVSAVAAFSTEAWMLIAARALLGVAGATLMPSLYSLLRIMFRDENQRRTAIAVVFGAFSAGGAVGPLLGGALLEFFWWGSVFLLGVPVMLLLLVCGPWLLPEFRDPDAGRQDWTSALLSVTTVLALIYGLKDLARNGPGVVPVLAIFAGLLIGALFVRRQRRLPTPMFDLTLFANREFSTSVGAMMLTVLALSGAWLMVFQYLQGVLGLSPLHAGLAMLPPAVLQTICSLLIPRLAHCLPRWQLVSGGLAVAVIGFLAIVGVNGRDDLPLLIAGMTVMGLGVMPMMILGTDMVVGAAPPTKAGAASATSETACELGMALGVAVIGSLGTAVYRHHMLPALPDGLSPEQALAAGDTLGGALGTSAALSPALAEPLMAAARAAFNAALHTNAAMGAAIVAATALLTAWRLRR